MKISELLMKLDLSKKEKYHPGDDFLNEFDISMYDVDTDKINLECIHIVVWYCTDTWVGIKIILLEDIPICLSQQVDRKSNEEFEWISKDFYLKIKEIIEAAKFEKEKDIALLDLDQEFGDTYKVSFAGELIIKYYNIHNIAILNGEKVSVENIKSNDYIEKRVKITFENGNSELIEVGNLDFPLLGIKNV